MSPHDTANIRKKLVEWLRGKMPQAHNLEVSNLEKSGAGFTSDSFLFDLDWDENGEHHSTGMILRCEGTEHPIYPDPKVPTQYQILLRLARTKVPVPKVYWFEDDQTVFGTPFYLMGKLDGFVPSEFPPYHSYGICYDAPEEQRARMWWELIEAVSRLHRLDWVDLDFAFLGVPQPGTGPIDQDLEYWQSYLDWVRDYPEEPHPILEAALKWLRDNRYEPDHVCLCWGDARMPNAIFSSEGNLLGLLDWDIAHLGDPVSDLAFITTLDYLLGEGIGIPRLKGLPGREETIQKYQELTGWEVKHFFYNEVRAACVAGLHVVKVQRNLRKLGVSLPGDDPDRDNFCTQYLARMLDLPTPGKMDKEVSRIEDLVATVQFRLTGEGAADWYIVCNRGEITRHKGLVENPNTLVTLPAATWSSIRKGETQQFHAWTSGELQIEGDHTILHLLEDVISKLDP